MTDNVSGPERPRRWLGAALVASLALNLFFAGLLAGGPLFRGGPPDGSPAAERLMPSPRLFAEVLGSERGREVLREMRAQAPDLRSRFRAMRETRLAVAAAMRAEPYDAAAVRSALEDMRAAHLELTRTIQTPLVGALERMTVQERARFADLFADPPRRSPGRGERPGPLR